MAKRRPKTPPAARSANHTAVVRPQGGPHPGHGDGANCSVCAVASTEAYLRGVDAANDAARGDR